jgi:hypothetical protein
MGISWSRDPQGFQQPLLLNTALLRPFRDNALVPCIMSDSVYGSSVAITLSEHHAYNG